METSQIFGILAFLLIFLFTVTFHEVAHGAVAFVRGDPTAKLMGRLTLNPLKHIDWFWTVLFPAMLFFSTGGRFMIGMAKPVPVNFSRLRNPKRDMILVGIAGPAANLIFAEILVWILYMTQWPLVLIAIYFNIGLAVFNMLPIPPLDGSRVVAGFLPHPLDQKYLKLEPFGILIVLALYFTRVLFPIVITGVNVIAGLLHVPPLVF